MLLDRINSVIKLLEDNKENLIEYFVNKEFNFSINNYHANKGLLFYDYMIPGLEIDNVIMKEITSRDCVTFINYSAFVPGVHLYRHQDPCPADANYQALHLHREFSGDPEYRRIHLPIMDSSDDCFMLFNGKKYTWKRGEIQIFDVHKYRHEVLNQSDQTFYLLMIDVLVGKE